jgi:hypothetical protein
MFRRLLSLLALSPLAAPLPAQSVPAATWNRAEVNVFTSGAIDRTIGWEFVANAPVEVTAIGVFDLELSFAPQGGLASTKPVALWDGNQTLLAQASVSAAGGSTLCQDGYRYVEIPPVSLSPGQTYVVGAFWPTAAAGADFDDYPDLQSSANPLAFHPAVSFVQSRFQLFTPTVVFPTGTLAGSSAFVGAVNLRLGTGPCEPNPPADLVTTFASNNGFAGNMFDLLAANPSGLVVRGWRVNLGDIVPQSAPINVSIYWRNGSHVGFTDSPLGWNLLGTVGVLSWGTNQATPIPLGGLFLPPNQTIGVYVFLTDYTQQPPIANVPLLNYTSIPPASPVYSNASLQLSGGVGKGAPPFTGPTFSNRMWNGGIRFCPALGSAEVPRPGTPPNPGTLLPGATSGPVLGSTWDPSIPPFLPGAAVDLLAITAAPLNAPTPAGTLLCDLSSPGVILSVSAGAPISIPIPDDCSLLGATICAQGASIAPGPVVGLTSALDLTIGSL